jgi:hypothetical protein
VVARLPQAERVDPALGYALDPVVLPDVEALVEAGGRPIARLLDVLGTRAAMLGELS